MNKSEQLLYMIDEVRKGDVFQFNGKKMKVLSVMGKKASLIDDGGDVIFKDRAELDKIQGA